MINVKDRLLAASRQYMHNNLSGFVEGYDKAEVDALVGELEAERDAALKRVDSRNQSLAKAWTRLSGALARVETLEKALQSVMKVSGPGSGPHGIAKRALASTTEAAESEEDSTEDLADLLHAAKNFLGALDFGDGVTRLKMRQTLEKVIARVEDN
jgi:cell division septum initiation protein DivIVA